MSFQSLTELANKQSRSFGGNPARPPDTCAISIRNAKAVQEFAIVLMQHACKRARFVSGDKVDIGFDQSSGAVLIKRVHNGRWTLRPWKSSKHHKAIHGVIPLTLTGRLFPGMFYSRFKNAMPIQTVEWYYDEELGGVVFPELPKHPDADGADKGW